MRNIISILAICTLGFSCSDNGDVTDKSPSENENLLVGNATTAWDVDAGKLVASWCSGCHGEDGTSTNRYIPHLAGQRMTYVVDVLEAYKKGVRDNPKMRAVVTALTDEAKREVAAYYAGRNNEMEPGVERTAGAGPGSEQEPPLPLLKWASACNRCHEKNGYVDLGSRPVLDGQREDYLTYALHTYQNRFLRDSSMMHAMTELLTSQDIRDLAAYYADLNGPSRVGATPPEQSENDETGEE